MAKLFLLVAGVFLIPVALSYGVAPAATLPKFMNITVEGTDQTHIFRALLLFYLAVELVVGTWGLFVLSRERRKAEAHAVTSRRS